MKSVLITGASSGFGMNAAIQLAHEGWQVFASMRNLQKAAPLEQAAAGQGNGDRIKLVELDVNDPASIERGLGSVLSQTGGTLDGLLNNAGYSALGAFEDMSDADCRRQMETNFFGTLAMTRGVIPVMRKAGHGRIVIISSNAVNSPHPMLTLYAASKWALDGWAEGLAMELAPFGIEVAVVQPGNHKTPFAEHVIPIMPEDSAYKEWVAMAGPGLEKLEAWGRAPEKATAPIVRAVADPDPPFRQAVGPDTVAFTAMKGLLPYEARAWALRTLLGLPQANQFTGDRQAVEGNKDILKPVKILRDMASQYPVTVTALTAAIGLFAGTVLARR